MVRAASVHARAPASDPLLHDRSNNFDAFRLIAAVMVIRSHQHPLMGLPSPKLWGNELGALGVVLFFAISGYLVTLSWLKDPSLWRFAARRVLRIWPGLLVVVVLCACVLGPLVTVLPLGEYLRQPQTWDYLHTLRLDVRYELPGVFLGNPGGASVNGSLWTIPLEVQCYAVLAVLGVLGLWRWRAASLVMLALLCVWLVWRYGPWASQPSPWSFDLQYGIVFAVGMVLACWRHLWIARRLLTTALAAAALWLLAQFAPQPLAGQATLFGLAVFAVVWGSASWPVVRRVGRWGDASYGVYIYAYPVQQTLVWSWGGQPWPFWPAFLTVCAVTAALAYLSWHLVEKPALRFKPHTPAPRVLAHGH